MIYIVYALLFCVCYCILYYSDPLYLIQDDELDGFMVVVYTLMSLLWPVMLAIVILYVIGIVLTMVTNKIVYGVAYMIVEDEEEDR